MEIDFRWPILLTTSIVLLFVARMLNDWVEPFGIHLSAYALYLLLPGILLRLRHALLLVAVVGLLMDAYAPIFFGYHLILLCAFMPFITINRTAIMRASPWQSMSVLLALNLAIMLIEAITLGLPWLGYSSYIARICVDILISEIVLIPLGFWFIAFQKYLLQLGRCDMSPADDTAA